MFLPYCFAVHSLFVHGKLDLLIMWHSKGCVAEFRRREKILVLVYSYSIFVLASVALTLVMIIVT